MYKTDTKNEEKIFQVKKNFAIGRAVTIWVAKKKCPIMPEKYCKN